MLAEQSLHEGNLEEALVQLQDQVRKNPAESSNRIFLFQLMSLLGQWDRALNQLNVLADMDASTLAMVQTYREALRCEMLRADVFAGNRSAMVFGEPEQWVALLMEALRLNTQDKPAEAESLRERALDAAPAISGSINEQAFEWLADADPRLGPVIEAIINGRYYWVPAANIRRVELEAPADLRDLVWMPAQFTWTNGGQTVALIPTRYPGSESSADNLVRMARKTDWTEVGGASFGLGQRLFATDVDDYAILDVRMIEFHNEPAASSADESSAGDDTGDTDAILRADSGASGETPDG